MSDDPDLPGDKNFRPLPATIDKVFPVTCTQCPPVGSGRKCTVCGGPRGAIAMAMTLSPEAQSNIHHNRLRYAELEALRRGEANRYAETRYRH